MASNYPTSLDSFTDPTSGSSLASPSHSGQHIDLNDAVEKLETKLGIGSSAASSATAGSVLVANGSGSTTWTATPYGLQFIKADTITSGTSKEITGVFSSSFTNYRIVISGLYINSRDVINFRFGTTAAGYYGTLYYDEYTGSITGASRVNNGAGLYVGYGEGFSGGGTISLDVGEPNTTNNRKMVHGTYYGGGFAGWAGGMVVNSTAYTSFTIYTNGGTTFLASNIVVYGYRKS